MMHHATSQSSSLWSALLVGLPLAVAPAAAQDQTSAQPEQAAAASDQTLPDVVLVHGALVDGSGWRKVAEILEDDGYDVRVVQLPLTGLEQDVAATRRILEWVDGPTVLVGHSYGGVVITAAGDHPDVEALVYVAALQPDAGESLNETTQLAPAAPLGEALIASEDGFVIVDPERFAELLAADVPAETASFLAISQAPTAAAAFEAEIEDAAWREKPAFAVVATQDKAVTPELQRVMSERSGAEVAEVEASHLVFLSQPQAVADVIEAAANATLDR